MCRRCVSIQSALCGTSKRCNATVIVTFARFADTRRVVAKKRMNLRTAVYVVVLSFVATAGVVVQDLRVDPGPLEKQAKQVTTESPVPRQLNSKPVQYPGEMYDTGGRGLVTLQITLDAGGKVAEIRTLRAQLVATTAPFNPSTERDTTGALSQSAINAARAWSFAPPASAPLTFPVAFTFFEGAVDVTLGPPPPPRGRGAAPR